MPTLPEYQVRPIDTLTPAAYNPRKISPRELEKLAASIREHGFVEPVVINKDGTIIGGHQRVKAAALLGMTDVPVAIVDIPKNHEQTLNLALNRIRGEFDEKLLVELITSLAEDDRKRTGFDESEIATLLAKGVKNAERANALRDRFLVPPMSILDSRQGYWQERKRAWLSLGIRSELGRDAKKYNSGGPGELGALYTSASGRDPSYYAQKRDVEAKLGHQITTAEFEKTYYQDEQAGGGLSETGTSVFDPVICELVYRWFCPPGGAILAVETEENKEMMGTSKAIMSANMRVLLS